MPVKVEPEIEAVVTQPVQIAPLFPGARLPVNVLSETVRAQPAYSSAG